MPLGSGGGVDMATLGLRLDGRQMRAESARTGASLNALGKTGSNVTKTMAKLGVTLAATIAFTKATKAAGDFEGAMARSLAIMGDVDDMMRGRLAAAARKVGQELNLGATQAAEAYFFLASAGLSAETSLASLGAVATFAKAGMFDMATATDLATDAQSALGLASADTETHLQNMTRVTDVLVKANTIANATVQQFATSLTSESGAALKTFGKDIEEGVAVLAAFADQGVKAELAGSGLSRIMRLMTAAAVNNVDAYEQLSVEVFNSAGEMNNMADIISDLERAFSGMSDEARVASLEQLGFTARVQGVILPLVGASEKIREYEAKLREAGGTTQEIADKQMLAPMERAGRAMKAFADEGISAGQAILKVLVPALESLGKNAGAIVDVVLALGAALLALQLAAWAPKIIAISIAMWGWTAATVANTAATLTMVTSVNSMSAALALLKLAIGPVGWVMLGVTAVASAVLIWRNRSREAREETEKLTAATIAAAAALDENLRALSDVNLETLRGRTLSASRQFGVMTPEKLALEERALIVLKAVNAEQERRRVEAANERTPDPSQTPTSITSDATKQATLELARLTALNEAFGKSASILAKINLHYDLQARLIENATTAKGEDLVALNAQTEALFAQKLLAIEMSEDQEKLLLVKSRERAQSDQVALNAAVGMGAVEMAKLNLELERRNQLALDAQNFQGQELEKAREFTNHMFDLKLILIDLNEELEKGKKLPELYEAAARGIQQALAQGFRQVTDGGLSGFQDMAESILNIFQNLAAEIASILIAEKLGLDDLLEKLRQGGELTKKQELAGAAIAGYGAGSAGPVEGAIGGAAAGGAIGGPWGALVGGVVGLGVGLFTAASKAREAQKSFSKTMDDFVKSMQPDTIASREGSLTESFRDIIMDFQKAFDIKNIRQTFRAKTGRGVGNLEVDTLVGDLTNMLGSLEGNSKAIKQWKKIVDAARIAVGKLSEEEAKRTKDFATNLRLREVRLGGSEAEILTAEFTVRQEKELEAARKLLESGTITTQMFERLASVLDQELAQAILNVSDSSSSVVRDLDAFLDSLKFGSASILSPVQQLEEARKKFEAARLAAENNDVEAAQSLPRLAQNLLEISRVVNASGKGFVEDFNRVQESVSLIRDQFADQAALQERQIVIAEEQVVIASESRDEILETNRILREGFLELLEGDEGQLEALEELLSRVGGGGGGGGPEGNFD